MKILVPQDVILDGVQSLIDNGAEIVRCKTDENSLIEAIRDCDVVLARTEIYSRRVLEQAKQLKIIARYGVGFEKIDLQAADDLGIWVTNTPSALTNAVAESVMLLMLATARHMRLCDKEMRNGNFGIRSVLGMELQDKVLGVIGFGRIGQMVAKKCHFGLDMRILAYDPYLCACQIPEYVTWVDNRDELLGRADVVSLHLPLTPQTQGSVGKAFFDAMKDGSIFINAARGKEVVEDDLIAALKSGKLYGAGLDCFSSEPLPLTNELYGLDNVVMTPHNASATAESFHRCSEDMGACVKDVMLAQKKPRFAVNHPAHPRMGSET